MEARLKLTLRKNPEIRTSWNQWKREDTSFSIDSEEEDDIYQTFRNLMKIWTVCAEEKNDQVSTDGDSGEDAGADHKENDNDGDIAEDADVNDCNDSDSDEWRDSYGGEDADVSASSEDEDNIARLIFKPRNSP